MRADPLVDVFGSVSYGTHAQPYAGSRKVCNLDDYSIDDDHVHHLVSTGFVHVAEAQR